MKFKRRNIILIYLEGNHDNRDMLLTFKSLKDFKGWQNDVFLPNQDFYINSFNNVRYFQANEIDI